MDSTLIQDSIQKAVECALVHPRLVQSSVLQGLEGLLVQDSLVCNLLGITRGALSNWRNGRAQIPPKRNDELVQLLKISHSVSLKALNQALATPHDCRVAVAYSRYSEAICRAGLLIQQLEDRDHEAA